MQFKVYPLRHRGRRLPWREVQNGPCFVGQIVTHLLLSKEDGQVMVATLMNPVTPARGALLPDLYAPVLLGFAPLTFRLRGFERWDGPEGQYSVVQEWHCENAW